jgi:hypothetical protein
MLIILAALGVIVVFMICFRITQWWIAHQRSSASLNESAQVRRTLENAARTLGGSDFLREYPPPNDSERSGHD